MPLEIRPIEPAEYDAVGEICVAAYTPFMDGDRPYMRTIRDVARRAAAAEVYVAAEERVLGTVTFVPEDGPLREIARPGEAEFRMLAVDPAAQGRGVALALLRWIIEESRARGRGALVCSTQPSMRAAQRIYARLGFERDPARDWSPLPGVDLIAFRLPLA